MPASKKTVALHTSPADTTGAVEALLDSLQHPFKPEILAIRSAILEASPKISEGVKWNAPSFRTYEYFATTNLREKAAIGVILHLGAKVRELGAQGLAVSDPTGLLKWLAPDRASVRFSGMEEFVAKRSAFMALVRAWIKHV